MIWIIINKTNCGLINFMLFNMLFIYIKLFSIYCFTKSLTHRSHTTRNLINSFFVHNFFKHHLCFSIIYTECFFKSCNTFTRIFSRSKHFMNLHTAYFFSFFYLYFFFFNFNYTWFQLSISITISFFFVYTSFV